MARATVSPDGANAAALLVFVAAFVALTIAGWSTGTLLTGASAPTAQTSVVERTTTNQADATPPVTTTTTEITRTTTTVVPDLLSRVIDGPTFWVLRLGVITVAAFIAAAVVQRVLLGRYEFKFWMLEVPSITGAQVRDAGKSAADASEAAGVAGAGAVSLMSATADPSLKLVALRIEIEGRVRQLLEKSGLPRTHGLRQWIDALAERHVIDQSVADSLNELVQLGNQAAHGVKVTASAGDWADSEGPAVLAYLDDLVRTESEDRN